MKILKTIIAACVVLLAHATHVDAFNYIFLLGKGVGGEMSCSDWNRVTTSSERAAMTQWVFGFITGYDAAIRPNPNNGALNGQPIADLIGKLCKEYPTGDLVSVAKYIAEYVQKELKGEVTPKFILNEPSQPLEKPAQLTKDMRTGVMFYCDGCAHPLDDVMCVGEAVSSRAISKTRKGDSGIGTDGNKCFFYAESSIGRQIRNICPIRDMNVSDEQGPMCVVEAAIGKDLSIKRVNKVQVSPMAGQ